MYFICRCKRPTGGSPCTNLFIPERSTSNAAGRRLSRGYCNLLFWTVTIFAGGDRNDEFHRSAENNSSQYAPRQVGRRTIGDVTSRCRSLFARARGRRGRSRGRRRFNKVRKDFDAAGIARTDEQILQTMNELMLKAGRQLSSAQGNAIDGAAVALARNIKSR